MGAFMQKAVESGALIETGGFGPSVLGVKVSLADGEYTVTDGPFSEAKELYGVVRERRIQGRGHRDGQGVPLDRRWRRVPHPAGLRPGGRPTPVTGPDAHRAIEAVWRMESAKIIGGLARIVRDVGLAEELAQDALVLALEKWPESGVPDNPGAWLMTAAKRRAIDHLRRGAMLNRKHAEITRDLEALQRTATAGMEAAADDPIGDDVLRLIFAACHPVLSPEARVALTLRLLGGLATDEIARAFLVAEPTIAQRIVRAKKTLAEARVPFEIPRGPELGSGSPRCSRSSTSCSTKATPRPRATTGCDRRSVMKPCAWGAS